MCVLGIPNSDFQLDQQVLNLLSHLSSLEVAFLKGNLSIPLMTLHVRGEVNRISPRPLRVPTVSTIQRLMVWFARESNMLLRALAPAAVPIRYSRIKFQPMKNATNSPTVT